MPADGWWSIVVLGLVCTALAFVVFFALIAAIGPARADVITYVNPAVAVLFGVLLLGEHVHPRHGVGFPLILAGSVLAARRRAAPQPAVPEAQLGELLDATPGQSMRTGPERRCRTPPPTTPVPVGRRQATSRRRRRPSG